MLYFKRISFYFNIFRVYFSGRNKIKFVRLFGFILNLKKDEIIIDRKIIFKL